MTTGWLIGYAIGAAVVLVVVALLLVLIAEARKIGDQAIEIRRALEDARANTLSLWEVERTNQLVEGITAKLAAARRALGG